MSRQGFKVNQLSDELLQIEANLIGPKFVALNLSAGNSSPALYVWEVIKIYQLSRRKKIWGAKLSAPLLEPAQINDPEMQLLNKQSLLGLPLAINRALLHWYVGDWKINLRTNIPEAMEILHEQTRGERTVSVLVNSHPLHERVHDGRDIFHFILHDLMHADQFFQASFLHLGQLSFYRWIYQCLLKLSIVERTQLLDNHEFSYVISDMNAYSVHLLKQLKHSLRETNYFELFLQDLAVGEDVKKILSEKNIYNREETLLIQEQMESLSHFFVESLA